MLNIALRVAGISLLVCMECAFSYDENSTHPVLSGAALRASDLAAPDSQILGSLGYVGGIHSPRWVIYDPFMGPSAVSISGLVMAGASAEDHDFRGESFLSRSRYRVFRHFFDPQNGGRPLTIFGPVELGESSTEWSLEAGGDIFLQEFSYADAKAYLLNALVGATESERDRNLRRVFLSLGHVIHHLQDMAQPQHVRNEDHCQSFGCGVFGRYYPSAYERYTAGKGRALPLDGYGIADYGTFQVPSDLWMREGMGIAEFTSHNFVGMRTNFRGARDNILPAESLPNPNGGGVVIERRQVTDADLLGPAGPEQPLTGEIWFLARAVTDLYRNDESGVNQRLSSFSIYNSDLTGLNDARAQAFTLTRFNYDAAHEFLLPRAAAYSTGLINYFFRGRIGIGLPGQGVYGIVDHATTREAGQGFQKLKLRLNNASPDGVKPSGEKVPQTMQGGTLVAVARYTLNSCYQPDLSGDFAVTIDTGAVINPANCTLDQYFAGEEQISQSAAILAASLDKEAADFTFDFSTQPIPVNARDLRIQVVYTGTLGSETDAIAFGGRDISEPTHLIVYNNSDYYAVDGKFYTPEQIRADATLSQRVQGRDIDPKPLARVAMTFVANQHITGAAGPVPVNGYVRVAVLADVDRPFTMNVLTAFEGAGDTVSTFDGIWAATIDLRGEFAYITPLGIYRDPRAHMVDVVFKANSQAPLLDGELVTMSGRRAGDPGPTPIPLRF